MTGSIDGPECVHGRFDAWMMFADAMRMPRDRAKRLAYRVMYGIETDPWVCMIVCTELDKLILNRLPKPMPC